MPDQTTLEFKLFPKTHKYNENNGMTPATEKKQGTAMMDDGWWMMNDEYE